MDNCVVDDQQPDVRPVAVSDGPPSAPAPDAGAGATQIREVRRTATLALPLIVGHLSTALVAFVDAVLAGRHGAGTLAAVATGAAIWQTCFYVLMGVLLALPPFVSQFDGAGRREEIGPLFRQALWLAAGLGLCLFAYLSAAPALLALLGVPPDIRVGAVDFLQGVRWGVPALALYLAHRFLSEGMHWTLPTMVIGIAGVALLAPLGYVLMFGAAGLPGLGARGLGYATAIMLWLQAAAFCLYMARARRFAHLRLYARLDPPRWEPIAGLLRVGVPTAVMVFMEGSMFAMAALILSHLGERPVAAHQIALNVSTLMFMIPMGLAEATTVRVGFGVGANDPGAVRRAAIAGFAVMLLTQLLSGLVVTLANHRLAALYTHDAAVATLAASLMLWYVAVQIPDGVQVLSAGSLRGLKDTRLPMVLTALSYWVVGLPLGAFLALRAGYGPHGMWIGIGAGVSVAAVLLGARLWWRLWGRPLAGSRTGA